MGKILTVLLCVFCITGRVAAADDPVGIGATLKDGFVRLGDESLGVVKAPFDWDSYGPVATLAVAGGVALTFVFDEDIRDKVAGTGSKTLDRATDIGDIAGNPFVHLGVAAAVYGGGLLASSPKWRETGEMLGEAAILADASTLILKQAIGRGRPYKAQERDSFKPFQFKSDYDSMPSMHTASSFAMASVLASTSENMAVKSLYYLGATFVGFSRMYKDKHWASDVVLGAAIGELCGRVVTSYHAGRSRFALVPMVTGDSAMLSLAGKW